MDDCGNSASALETFYVYRTLHSDESWAAILGCCSVSALPNIDFGMMVFAANEKEAIARGRELYEKIHKWDSDRDNVRRFAAAALKSVTAHYIQRSPNERPGGGELDALAKITMDMAIAMNKEYKSHFERLDKMEQYNEDSEGI